MSYMPPGFSPVTPYFHVKDAAGFMDFLREAFDAETVMDHRDDGKVFHAEMKVFGAMVEISEARDDFPAMPAAFHCYVPDTDAAFAKAVAAGAEATYPVEEQSYGERSGGLRDKWGNHWYIGTVTDMAKRTAT